MTRRRRRPPWGSRGGLASRLLGAQLLTIAVGAATLVIVASLVGPSVLNAHLHEVLGPLTDEVRHHLEEGYTRAAIITIAFAGAASLAIAVAVSLLVTRRLAEPIGAVAAAATRVAAGDYEARVPTPALGAELEHLASAFNIMATALDDTERSRRRLLGDVAHELRTPLATIRACHEALADGIRKPDEETWTLLAAQTGRIQRLIEDIALVSSAEERALPMLRGPVDVAAVVASAIAAVEEQYRSKNVALQVDVADTLPAVDIDSDRIGQVLTNLLTNALRHTPPGGHVAVVASWHAPSDLDMVRIAVTDDGEGIAAADLPRLFERFYRADAGRGRDQGGSGIGLTVARALTVAHGGTLSAASDGPGQGSQFTIMLPVAR